MTGSDNTAETNTRRHFFKVIIGLFASVNALALGLPFVKTLLSSSPLAQKEAPWTKLAELDSLPEGEPVEIRFEFLKEEAYLHKSILNSAWVIRHSDSKVTVFSPVCTHLGCHYSWNSGAGHFECPCHSSVFSPDGKVLSGPAPRPLDLLPAKIEKGVVFVKWEQFRAGNPKKNSV